MSRRGVALALMTLVMAASACTSGSAAKPTPTTPTSRFSSYVALGDSYTAGPFIATTDLAGGCLRSDHNYPSLLATQLGISDFKDVSCSAATTHDLSHPQSTYQGARLPAQLRALNEDTDLVTLGIGGNDFNLFRTLVQTCTLLRSSAPAGSPCTDSLEVTRPHLFRDIGKVGVRVARSLDEIKARAPHATVVLVGYLRLAPARGTCPDKLPLADGDYPEANRVSLALSRALAGAAKKAGATFVNMFTASAGHDVCAGTPWVNGRKNLRDKAIAYHPFEAGMVAVASRVEAALR